MIIQIGPSDSLVKHGVNDCELLPFAPDLSNHLIAPLAQIKAVGRTFVLVFLGVWLLVLVPFKRHIRVGVSWVVEEKMLGIIVIKGSSREIYLQPGGRNEVSRSFAHFGLYTKTILE